MTGSPGDAPRIGAGDLTFDVMWWRRKADRRKPERPPGYGRQIWLRRTNPIEAITGQYGDWEPVVGDEPGQVYDDEIDPAWRDPETAADGVAEQRPSTGERPHPTSQARVEITRRRGAH